MSPSLTAADAPLARLHDVALLDLDGVVYVGAQAVDHAPQALARAREFGMRLTFVTNNAARPPAEVAEHLRELGIAAVPDEVVTSSQAAAHYLAEQLPAGAKVLVVGTTGLIQALQERGLVPVRSADEEPEAVVQGYSPRLDWAMLAEGAVAIRRGLPWVATNLDPTVPSPRGPLPGNGSLVAALRHATGREPVATGKPDPTMHRETVQRSQAERPLVVGDRLDTDIEGADRAGCPSLLVLTGVTSPRDLVSAPPSHRPTFIAPDLRGLLRTHPGIDAGPNGVRCGAWAARVDGTTVLLSRADGDGGSSGSADADGLDGLRAICAAVWSDDALFPGAAAGSSPEVTVRGEGAAARQEVDRLGLS